MAKNAIGTNGTRAMIHGVMNVTCLPPPPFFILLIAKHSAVSVFVLSCTTLRFALLI